MNKLEDLFSVMTSVGHSHGQDAALGLAESFLRQALDLMTDEQRERFFALPDVDELVVKEAPKSNPERPGEGWLYAVDWSTGSWEIDVVFKSAWLDTADFPKERATTLHSVMKGLCLTETSPGQFTPDDEGLSLSNVEEALKIMGFVHDRRFQKFVDEMSDSSVEE